MVAFNVGFGLKPKFKIATLKATADETYERCCEASHEPGRPDALRHRMEDHVLGLHLPLLKSNTENGLSADPRENPFYVGGEIMRLRYAPPPWDPVEILAQRARIAEIEREHEAWLDRCRAADQVDHAIRSGQSCALL